MLDPNLPQPNRGARSNTNVIFFDLPVSSWLNGVVGDLNVNEKNKIVQNLFQS